MGEAGTLTSRDAEMEQQSSQLPYSLREQSRYSLVWEDSDRKARAGAWISVAWRGAIGLEVPV